MTARNEHELYADYSQRGVKAAQNRDEAMLLAKLLRQEPAYTDARNPNHSIVKRDLKALYDGHVPHQPEPNVMYVNGRAISGRGDLSNYVFIFDTLKKYIDLMSKRGSREFFRIMRSLTQRGATVLLLGHCNKQRTPDGKLVFEGVGDVRNDVDELIYVESSEKDAAGCVTITMTPDKVRCKAQPLTFRLNIETMDLQQIDKPVDVRALNEAAQRRRADAEVIDLVLAALKPNGKTRTKLIDEVHDAARPLGKSRREVERVINDYCGTSAASSTALWVEHRMLQNNTRYITRKTGGQA